MQWSDAYKIGVPTIDADHQLLFALTSQLAAAREEGQVRDVVGSVMNVLAEYVIHHFRREEELMETVGFPELAEHRLEHRFLAKRALDLRHRWRNGDHGATDSLVELLRTWLSGHILVMDIRYKPWVEKYSPDISDRSIGKRTDR